MGRFIQPDTIVPNPGDVQSFDRYAYVNNNPLRYTDPTGHDPCDNGAACGEPSYSPDIQALHDAFMQREHGDYTWEMFYADLLEAIASAGGLQLTNYHTYPDLMAQAYQNRFGEAGFLASPKIFFFTLFNPNEVAAGIVQAEQQRVSALTGVLAGLAAQKMAAGALGGPCSFANDTLVATADGPKPITAVEEGELIYAYNEATGKVGLYPVTAELAHLDRQIVTLVISGERIVTTPEHPFYTTANGWTPAGTLQVGDEIRRADSGVGTVQTIAVAERPQVMYNLTVADAHTFFVGTNQWLVHNQCNNSPLGRGSTGRNTPNNLQEQLALEVVQADPAAGRQLRINMTDPRWPAKDGWVKMAQNVNGIEIHYAYNPTIGAFDDLKFK
jgi:hypothetical protein